jgi:hypothetical protein
MFKKAILRFHESVEFKFFFFDDCSKCFSSNNCSHGLCFNMKNYKKLCIFGLLRVACECFSRRQSNCGYFNRFKDW